MNAVPAAGSLFMQRAIKAQLQVSASSPSLWPIIINTENVVSDYYVTRITVAVNLAHFIACARIFISKFR